MRQIITVILLFVSTLFVQAQNYDTLPIQVPKNSIWLDIANYHANYPAILLSYERQVDKNIAFHQELGPVIIPEAYDEVSFDKYLGFKGRTEGRLYVDYRDSRRSRYFFGVDIAYQFDQYVGNYERDRGGFSEIVSGRFTRQMIGTHLRVGAQRFFSNDRLIASCSIGLGRSFINVNYPEGYRFSFPGGSITEYPDLDPLSGNIRVKIGYVLGKL
jgi:hypothetical protein